MIAISLVAAASCAGLAAFGYWRQQTATNLALHRELESDYTDMLNAMESDTRAVQVVANALATIPELKALVRGKDREGIINLLSNTLKRYQTARHRAHLHQCATWHYDSPGA